MVIDDPHGAADEDNAQKNERRGEHSLLTAIIFSAAIFLLIVLLYFAY